MLANSKFDALTFGRTAREIAVLCDKHSVPCGAPEDLAVFLRALDGNKHLAMEFWSLVARATERNPRATTDPGALLTSIVEAVTGQTLAEFESAGATQRLLVKRTAGMLAGEDMHAPIAPGPFAAARDISPAEKPEPAPAIASPPPHKQQLRLVLDPNPPTAIKGADNPEPNAPPLAIPLSAYAEAEPDRRTLPRVLAGIVLMAVIAGGWFVLRHNPSLWHRADNAGTQAPAISKPQPQAAAPQPQTPPALAPQAQTPRPQAPIAPPPVKSVQAQPTAVALPPKPAATSIATPAKDRGTESDAIDNPQIVVPEELMRQNLISSRVPVAAAAHGIVVLQAVITTRGTVEHLRAIQGDPALRRAAIDAAATWRYRPYLLNGTPVDVSTTISVDFSGND